jgi:hypothetical protein
LVVVTGGGATEQRETRDAVKQPTMPKTEPHNKDLFHSKCKSVTVENSCFKRREPWSYPPLLDFAKVQVARRSIRKPQPVSHPV